MFPSSIPLLQFFFFFSDIEGTWVFLNGLLQGKKSISEHMNEAANYIKHQQKKIQELTEKRDLLQRRVILSPSNSKSSHCHEGIFSSSPLVEVMTTFVGAAVVIVCQPGHEVPLSRVISSLIEEGLNVISVSTSINAQWVYSLECEVHIFLSVIVKSSENSIPD